MQTLVCDRGPSVAAAVGVLLRKGLGNGSDCVPQPPHANLRAGEPYSYGQTLVIARGSEAFDVAGRLATSSGSLQQKPVQGELEPVLKMLGEGSEAI